jgi:phage-related protein
MAWSVEYLDDRVRREIATLPSDIRAKLARVAGMIEAYGLSRVGMPYVRHVEGKLWEIRVRGQDGIARVFYVAAMPQRVILLHAFVKKTQKTPRCEIKKALQAALEVQDGKASP